MAHVFISYKRENKAFALEVKEQLQGFGFEVWLDEKIRPGRKWRDEIDEELREAFAVTLIVTPQAMQSEYVTYEWIFALGAGVEVIPLYLETVEKFPYRLEDFQYIDFRGGDRPWGRLFKQVQEVQRNEMPEAVKQAIEALNIPNTDERRKAIETLAQMNHPAAADALVAAIKHPTKDVRVESALKLVSLGFLDNANSLPAFVEAFPNASLDGRVKILEAIAAHKYFSAKDLVIRSLYDDHVAIQAIAVQALGKIGDSSDVSKLAELLKVDHHYLRQCAAEALSQLGDVAVPDLLQALDSKNNNVRAAAAWALGPIKNSEAVEKLVKALNDVDANVRAH